MARIRTIKPDFYANEKLSSVSLEAHFLAGALLNYADDDGYFNANPKLVAASCVPLRDEYGTPTVSVLGHLRELSNIGYLELGTCSDGRLYGRIIKFRDHQVINKAKESKIKALDITWEVYGTDTVHVPYSSHMEREREREKEGEWNKEGSERSPGSTGEAPEKHPEQEPETAIAVADEKPSPPALPAKAPPTVITLTLNDKSEYPINVDQVSEWEILYPAVDVMGELRKMRGWCTSNEKKRKTARGILRFVNGWLSDEQDKGGKRKTNGSREPPQTFGQMRAEQNKRAVDEFLAGFEDEQAIDLPSSDWDHDG